MPFHVEREREREYNALTLPFPVHTLSVQRASFATGFSFNYWNHFEPNRVQSHMDAETADKMKISPHHKSLKDEVVGEFLSNKLWKEKVVLKAQKYLKSKSVNKITAERARHGTPTGQHSKKDADGKAMTLSMEHLFAVILYCDFGALCTAFSATFRLQNVFEDINSLKSRHSKFAHFGRLLVETVLDFGINGYVHDENPSAQTGPFFCGLNYPLNFGSYAIILSGPCSTSTQRSVALNFAKSKGVIMTLNNDNGGARNQCFFDCSWISNYFEESERLWIAGARPLRIESVVIVRNARNYRKMMRTFYLFDAMLSGVTRVSMSGCAVQETESDFALLSDLIRLTLDESHGDFADFDLYLKNEWKLFLQNKEKIVLNLDRLKGYFKVMSKLVMFNVVNNRRKTVNGKDNVMKGEWISMFPALKSMEINTLRDFYKFRFEAFLDSMKSIPSPVTMAVNDGGRWIESALSDEVLASYDAAGWSMEYKAKKLVIQSNGVRSE